MKKLYYVVIFCCNCSLTCEFTITNKLNEKLTVTLTMDNNKTDTITVLPNQSQTSKATSVKTIDFSSEVGRTGQLIPASSSSGIITVNYLTINQKIDPKKLTIKGLDMSDVQTK